MSMIGQIGHLGKVSFKVGITSSLLYTTGVVLGAGIVGATLGALGLGLRWFFDLGHDPYPPAVPLVIASAALIAGLRDLDFIRLTLPQPDKQVPEVWMQVFGPNKTGFLWGFFIGLALSTRIQFSAYYVLAFWVVLTGQPLLGAAALATYGLTQGALLTAEMIAITLGVTRYGGLLGLERSRLLYPLGGMFLLACTVFLLFLFLFSRL